MTVSRAATVPEQARALRQALEALATALDSGDSTSVLAQQAALQAALRAAPGALDAAYRDAVRHDLLATRAALTRCRAIGAATADLTRITLEALGRTGAYSRHGAGASGGPRGRDLHARV